MRLLVSALIGLGVMVASILPPILHFVTGPLGPVIGGFIAGFRARCNVEQAAAIGALMAGLLIAVGAAVMALAVELAPAPIRGIDPRLMVWVAMGVFLLVFLMASVGAWIGGAYARRSGPPSTPPSK